MLSRCKDGLSSFPVTIPGPCGDIEGKIDCAMGSLRGGAVICHPHPLYGGSLQNKVVHTLAKSLAAKGFTALRFNFRGVGTSAGSYDDGRGEVDDALAAVDWLNQSQAGLPMILAGFSFGSFVAMQTAAKTGTAALITVAPPVRIFDFDDLSSIHCPWLLIQGDEDEVVDADAVVNWARNLALQPELEIVHGSSHFFHGKLLELRSLSDDFIEKISTGPSFNGTDM